jgi:outer membrane receptor protein involved in Fe transport
MNHDLLRAGWRYSAFVSRTSLLSIACALAAGAHAQSPQTDSALPSSEAVGQSPNEGAAAAAEIIVTGSRITTAGFSAPTPTTVIGVEAIERNAQPNVFNTIAQLPSLQGSTGTTTGNGTTSQGNNGLSSFGLRGLGTIRSLTLIDGQRIAPAYVTGIADVSQLPQLLIQRVDVVTGGASASYGSDAVAGVVNIITNKKFEGFKANIQGGITTYGDDRSGLVQVAIGRSFLDGRLHVEMSGEYYSNKGVPPGTPGDPSQSGPNGRHYFQAPAIQQLTIAGTPAGQPQYNFVLNSQNNQYSRYGLITAGPLQGIAFGAGGVPYTFVYGSNGVPSRTAAGGVIGCTGSTCVGGDLSGSTGNTSSLDGSIDRKSGYGRASYDLSSDIEIYGTFNYSLVKTAQQPNAGAAKNANLTIQCDNAYLPDSIKAACAANNITSFQYGTSNIFFPRYIEVHNEREQRRYVGGIDGSFQLFGKKWSFDGYFQHGENRTNIDISDITLTPRYNAAIDAVTLNGQIVCRSATARAAGCVPLNIIGATSVSDAAFAYIAPAVGPHQYTFERQEAASFSINGSPFSLPGGDVSVAFGGEYREEAYRTIGDPYGNGVTADTPNTADYPADAVLNTTQGNNWYAGNYHNGQGKYHVMEGFLELNVPLFDNGTLGRANFNPAFRGTNYSTSGYVSTWKLGATWDTPVPGVRLRAVRSRDIRAPNLSELFAAPVIMNNSVIDRATGQSVTILNTAIGNPDLKPEIAQNLEAGIVYRPSFLPGFNTSFDFYDIKVRGAIAALSNQQIVDLCFNGNTAFCPNVFLGGTPGSSNPSYVIVQPFNLAAIKTRGFDIEASYQFRLDRWHLPGSFTIRALATHVISYLTDAGVSGQMIQQAAGWNQNGGSVPTPGTPHWKAYAVESWSSDRFNLSLTERFVSRGNINPNYIECQPGSCPVPTIQNPTINYNRLPSALYLDVGGGYNLTKGLQAYFKIDNVFNKQPPPLGNPALYDTIGRTFRIGVRFSG